MDRDRFIVVSLVGVDHCIPCGIFQIHWDSHDSVEEEIVVIEDLGIGVSAKKVHSSFWHKKLHLVHCCWFRMPFLQKILQEA